MPEQPLPWLFLLLQYRGNYYQVHYPNHAGNYHSVLYTRLTLRKHSLQFIFPLRQPAKQIQAG